MLLVYSDRAKPTILKVLVNFNGAQLTNFYMILVSYLHEVCLEPAQPTGLCMSSLALLMF